MNLTPQQWALIRTLAKLLGAAATAHGLTKLAGVFNDWNLIETIIGAVVAIAGAIGTRQASTPAAIQQAAADSLPPGTVLPATTDTAPKAIVTTPEGATELLKKSTVQASTDAVQPKP